MSWLLPSALGIAVAAAVVAVALHFIARSRPVAEPLPTARFIPNRPIHARTRSFALTDLLLLAMRVAALAALGLAVAGPMFGRRGEIRRVVMVDASRAVANIAEVRDSVKAIANASDVVIAFDSAAHVVPASAIDSLRASNTPGSLSAALAAATQAAVRASPRADSLELVLVSPLVLEEIDAATASIRASWPGRIRIVPVAAATSNVERARVEMRGAANDAIAAGVSLMGVASPGGTVRVVRSVPTREDSLWATTAGRVLVHWPASDDVPGWKHREAIDAIGGVTANGATVVSRFPRLWVLEGATVARWSDGTPAAVEHATGDGCIRDVGVLIDDASDLALRPSFRRFAAALLGPCGGAREAAPIDAAMRVSLAGSGPLAAATSLRDRTSELSPWTPWLLALAALLLVGELAMRRTVKGAPA
jgi:hypothetical protein